MEASESSVVESPTEPPSAPVVPAEVLVEPEPRVGVDPVATPGRIELSTGMVHDIQDISACEDLSRQAGAGFQEFIRADGKPINISLEEIVSYE